MLSGAVSGAVFASPPPSEIEEGLLQIGRGGKGEMHFSKNKTQNSSTVPYDPLVGGTVIYISTEATFWFKLENFD